MSLGSAPGPVTVLRGHQSEVQAVVFHPRLDILYSGDAGGELRIWDTASRRPLSSHRIQSVGAGILALGCLLSDSGSVLISQGRQGTIRIFALAPDGSLPSSEPTVEFCTHCYTFCRMSVLCTAVQQDREPLDAVGVIACPGEDSGSAELWGVQSGTLLLRFMLPPGVKFGMCMSMHTFQHASAGYLAVGYEDGHIAVWAAAATQQPVVAKQLHTEPVTALAIDGTAAGGISGSAEKQVVCFSLDLEACTIVSRKTIGLQKEGIDDVALRPDGRIFATAGWDGRVRIYGYRKASCLAILKYHGKAATALAFSPSQLLASAARDGTVALWSVYRDTP